MKKILYNLLIFVSVFFFLDKVSALGHMDSASEGTSLATFYATYGHTYLYGRNGSGSTCDNQETAPLECYKNGTLSLLTVGEHDIGVNTSIRFLSPVPIKYGKTYKVTIDYIINGSAYSYMKDHWTINRDTYSVSAFSSTCSSGNCQITYTFTSKEDSDYVWIQGNNSDYRYTFNQFNAYVAKMYMPKVEEVKYTPPPIPSGSDVVYFDTKSSNFISTYKNISGKLDEVLNILKNKNLNNYRWAVYVGEDSSGSFVSVNLLPTDFSSNPTDSNYAYCYVTAFKYSSYYYNAGGCYTNNVATKRYTFRSNSSTSTLETDLTLAFSNISGKITGSNTIQHSNLNQFNFNNHMYDYFTNNNYFILPYASSVPIYNYHRSSGSTYYHIKIGDNNLSFDSGSYLEPSDEIISVNLFNSFNEEVDDINYSKMIFEFDVSVLKEKSNIFDYSIDFKTLGFINEDGSLSKDVMKFSRPYIEYVDEYGIKKNLEIDFDYKDQDLPRSSWAIESHNSFYGDISSLKLIIPMHDTAYTRYLIQLSSLIPFTISYEVDEELFSHYQKVEVTGKYGIVFIPKIIENNSHISTLFYTRGIDKVLVYDSYNYNQNPIAIYDEDISNFTYNFAYEDTERNLFFVVNYSGYSAFVEYDTRYYTYEIVDSKYSVGTIVNPNTGNSHYVDFSNTANAKVNFESIGDVFYFISDKIDTRTPSYLLFKNSVDAFFNTMSTDLYVLILTVLAVILIGTALALGGWK